jgi:hypothetical protein
MNEQEFADSLNPLQRLFLIEWLDKIQAKMKAVQSQADKPEDKNEKQ